MCGNVEPGRVTYDGGDGVALLDRLPHESVPVPPVAPKTVSLMWSALPVAGG